MTNTFHHWAGLLLACLCIAATTTACIDEEEMPDTPSGNLEALWRIIDERYCFLDYKQKAIGLDWDEVHARYSPQVHDGMTDIQLLEVMRNMLSELRDGHVNIYTSFNLAREWS